MKAFVRTSEGYFWKRVNKEDLYIDGHIRIDGEPYGQQDILKILGEVRDKYAMCDNCQELFKLGEFEMHKADRVKRCNCADCEWLSRNNRKVTRSKTIKMLPDGTAIQKESVTFTPKCELSIFETLELAKEEGDCVFYKCKTFSCFSEDNILLLRRPNWFKKLITESSLIAHKWKLERRNSAERIYIKNGIKCAVDPSGVVMHFRYENSPKIMYSPEYDEFAKLNGREFIPELERPCSTSPENWDKTLNAIRRLRR